MKSHIMLLMLVASALFGCGRNTAASEADASGSGFTRDENGITIIPDSPLSSSLKLAETELQDIDIRIRTTASVNPKSGRVAEIGLPFDGRVVRSFVKLGDPVHRGQALFEVSSSEYMSAVKDYIESKGAAELADSNKRRKETLHQSGMISDREWEEICTEARNAANACEMTRRSLALFNVDPSSVQVGEPLRVVSPISGRVVRNELVTGGYLAADDEAPMTVADLSVVWVTANVNASQAGGITAGQPALIETGEGGTVEGKVFYVGEILDEKSRTLPVVVECDNSRRELKPGMFVPAVFERHVSGAMIIPSSAIFQGEGSKFVYVKDGERHFTKYPVQVESLEGGRQRVISGLEPGMTILADGGIYFSK